MQNGLTPNPRRCGHGLLGHFDPNLIIDFAGVKGLKSQVPLISSDINAGYSWHRYIIYQLESLNQNQRYLTPLATT